MCERETNSNSANVYVCIFFVCVFTVQDREGSKGFACRAVVVAQTVVFLIRLTGFCEPLSPSY